MRGRDELCNERHDPHRRRRRRRREIFFTYAY